MTLIDGKSCLVKSHEQGLIYWRIVIAPPFAGLWRFPEGHDFNQWTGGNSKALMKVATRPLKEKCQMINVVRSTFMQYKAMCHLLLYAWFVLCWISVILLDDQLWLKTICHNLEMPFPIFTSTVRSLSHLVYKRTSWSRDNMCSSTILHSSTFLEHLMDFVCQLQSQNISELWRNPGDGQVNMRHLAKCWSQINDLTNWQQHEATLQIGECLTDLWGSRCWKLLVSLWASTVYLVVVNFYCFSHFHGEIYVR